MSFTIHGTSVSKGIAIGKVHIIERDQLDIREYRIQKNQVQSEIKRLDHALNVAKHQLRAIKEHIPKSTSEDISAFIDTHILMLEDAALSNEPKRIIEEQYYNAEWALKLQRDALAEVFDEMDDPYLRTRKDDIDHVVNRIQRILLKQSPLLHEVPDSHMKDLIILADDLTPSDTVLMQHNGIAAFATEGGGPTSHTAILARSLGIPAIVGLHEARRYIQEEEEIILDGSNGVVVVEADAKSRQHYEKKKEEEARYKDSLNKLIKRKSKTKDNVEIKLNANIELASDFDLVNQYGADGVGLYRTEFLYMNRETPPDEEEHFQTYKKVIKVLDGRPLTIRTMDIGADKQVDSNKQTGPVQTNPALGLRAIRLCLKEPSLFEPQLRAILKASAFGPVRMMIPMLSNLHESMQVLSMIEKIKADLSEQGVEFDENIPIGGMVEVPAAAVCADLFAKDLDFLSIGTNDLIQYTMAIDRVNDEVSYLYDPLNPAVLKLIYTTIQAGKKAKIPVSMCGEMAGERQYTRLLLALGLTEFSLHPMSLLEVKKIILESNIEELLPLSKKVLKARSGLEVAEYLNSYE